MEFGCRQLDDKSRATPGSVFDPDHAGMQPHVLSHQREAESTAGLAAALPGVLAPSETLETLGPQLDGHPRP